MTDKKGTLPNGWIVKMSKNYPDRVYYFNVLTGNSSWDCPQLDPPKISPKEMNNDAKYLNVMSEHTNNSDRKVSEDSKGSHKLHRLSDECSSTSVDAKSHTPPTAIVAPVVHKRKISPSAVVKGNSNMRRLKRSNDSRESNEYGSPVKVHAKRKKASPLNKSESEGNFPPGNKAKQCKKSSSENNPGTSSCGTSKDINDVEMQDVSVDLKDDLASKKETVFDTSACYYIVVDTNVLISELSLISELKDTPLDGCGPPHIFIPWVVIEELDKLKGQRISKANWAAAEAIRYLNTVLSKHPRFHGQSPAEEEEWSKTYSKCNDDKILECCVALSDKMPPEKVILLTNDKNLVNKALILKLNVHNFESMMKKVKPDTVFNYEEIKKDRRKKNKEKKIGSEATDVSPNSIEEKMLQSKRDECKREIHTLMSNARLLLKGVLAKFLADEMFGAYGKVWASFPIEKKLLKGILEGIRKYWKMVFSEFLSEKDKRNFELLLEKANRPEGFLGDKDECLVILSTIEDIFRKVRSRCPNSEVPIEMIQDYRVACVNAFVSYCEAESSIRMYEEQNIVALFDKNWTAMNQLCGTIADHYQVQHDIDYCKDSGPLPDIEIRRLMVIVYPDVRDIKRLMCNLLDAVKNCKPTKKWTKDLATALLKFIPSLHLPYEPTTYPFFSPKALERFFTCPRNRQMIEIGIKQVEEFFAKLDDILCKMLQGKTGVQDPEKMICD